MNEHDVVTRLLELHDHIQPPPTSPGADAARGERMLRRRRTVVAGAVAAAVLAVLGIVTVTTGGLWAGDRIEPIRPGPTATDSPSADDEWSLERIRAEGRVEEEQVTKSGITLRTYVLCDGTPDCSPHTDGPIRREHEHFAIEVTQDARSALFRIGNSAMTVVTGYDDATLLVMDPLLPTVDPLDPYQNSYRLVRADGTESRLQVDSDPAPAVPGPGVVLINHYDIDPDNDSMESQIVLVVDENEGTVRVLDMPQNIDMRRTWGPNPDEFLWFVTFSCDVYLWTSSGTFETRRGGCAGSFDPGHYQTDESGNQTDDFGNQGNGDITWVNGDWFPNGWLEPGRMAFLERNFLGRNESRLTLHVTLDQGATWRRIPVSDEAAIPDALRQLG
jgi:hypothetical protein